MHNRRQKLSFPRGGLSAAPGRLLQKKQGECETQRHQWHRRVGLCVHYHQMLRGHLPSPNIAPANEGGRLDDELMLWYAGEAIEMKNNEIEGCARGERRSESDRECLNLIANSQTANGSI